MAGHIYGIYFTVGGRAVGLFYQRYSPYRLEAQGYVDWQFWGSADIKWHTDPITGGILSIIKLDEQLYR